MKQYTHLISRMARLLPLMACIALLAACHRYGNLSLDKEGYTSVTFNASIQSSVVPEAQTASPHTRTTIDANGNAVWTKGDAVGVFMMSTGGTTPAHIISGAENRKYTVNHTTGELTPAGSPIFYPGQGAVDFVAYYPYKAKGTGDGEFTEEYQRTIPVTDQSDPASIDLLRAEAGNRNETQIPVDLTFSHVMSKIKLNIIPGSGLSTLAADKITAVTLVGMPASVTFDPLADLCIPGNAGNIVARRESAPSDGAAVSFTALIPGHSGAGAKTVFAGRRIVVTVDGVDYTTNLPDADSFTANDMYVYPVTVEKTGITLGEYTLAKWETNDHGTGVLEYLSVSFDANEGSGTPPPNQELTGNKQSVTLPGGEGLLQPPGSGKFFIGWNTSRDYSGDFYRKGAIFTPTQHTTLYAVWSGDGSSADNPILIFDADGLADMANTSDKSYSLMKDITVTNWVPVGNDAIPFTGSFDGRGHTVTIRSFDGTSNPRAVGLFGSVNVADIRRVCVAGNIEYSNENTEAAGGIAGMAAEGSVIENCLVTANLVFSKGNGLHLGGIVGKGVSTATGAIVQNCLMLGNMENGDTGGSIGGIGCSNLQIVNCVVLSAQLKANDVRRIGSANILSNNYANKDMSTGGGGMTPGLAGQDGADCAPRPDADWWTTTSNWKTDEGYTGWDFSGTWEMNANGYPRLRIVITDSPVISN